MTIDFRAFLNNWGRANTTSPQFEPLPPVPVEMYNPFKDVIDSQRTALMNAKIPLLEMPVADEVDIQRKAAEEIKSKRVKNSAVRAELGDDFLKKVKEVAKRLNCNYKDLIGLMNSESGLNPRARNKRSRATGLIQFMPSTARELGTTVDELQNMSAIDQLDYVEKYLANAKRIRFGSKEKLDAGELYALTYLPARANRSVLAQRGEKYYSWNKGLDLNNDGKITKEELAQRVERKQVSDMYFA